MSDICEQRLGSKQFVNIMMLGVAFQLGLIPVSAHSIAWAIKDTIKREHMRNLKAFNIGRKLAMEPTVLPAKPEPRTWDQLLTQKGKIVRKTRLFGPKLAAVLERLIQTAMRLMHNLSESQKYDLALRIYDIMQCHDERMARKYIQMVKGVYRRDNARRGFAATEKFIWNLAKVILIKDEVYVSYLLTRFEKKYRDIIKYGVDIANGDRIVYRHHTKPEFQILGFKFKVNLTTTDWMLQIVQRMKFLRKLPGWHLREKQFRDWYMKLPARVDLTNDASYEQAVKILNCAWEITGYREIRYPKMRSAMEWVEQELLREIGKGAIVERATDLATR
jgi:indolepyruvate ferredoxin oxidoreductase